MSIFVDAQTRVIVQGITGVRGSFHAGQMLDYGTKVVAGVTPGRGGTVFAGAGAGIRHGARGGRADGRDRLGHLRAAAVRGRRDPRGGGRGRSPGRVHHRGRADARHGAGAAVLRGTPARASSARTALASSARTSAKSGSCPGTSMRPGASGWSRDRGTLTYEAVEQLTEPRPRPVHRGGHRRRSGPRHELRRLPGPLRGGSADRGRRS